LNQSELIEKYEESIDRESAHEILSEKIDKAREAEQQEELRKQREKASRSTSRRRAEKSTLEKIMSNPTTRQIGRTIARELTRGLLGVLGVGGTKKRRKR
jgi:topoisomerase IA-like protein